MSYQVQLEVFAGPLDLLLHLIERSELDIYDIPIAAITGQFLAYLYTMELLNLEVAGEFLVMAATLMQIKARMLLPKPIDLKVDNQEEEEEDPRRELVERLVEYRRIKEAASLLRQREQEQALLFPRFSGDFADLRLAQTANPIPGISIWDLIDAFQTVLAAIGADEPTVPVPAEEVSVKQVMLELLKQLADAEGSLEFTAVFAGKKTRRGLITAFIALLELIRLGRVIAIQKGGFGPIILRPRPSEEVPM